VKDYVKPSVSPLLVWTGVSNILLSVMCQFEVIGADMSSYDKSFTRVIAKTEIEQQVGLFNSTGEPTFGALANANLHFLEDCKSLGND